MGFPRLAAAVLVAVIAAAPRSWGQSEADDLKKLKLVKDGGKKSGFGGAGDELMEKKPLDCPKGVDCKKYLIDKKNAKAKKRKMEEAEPTAGEEPPGDPAAAPVESAAAAPAAASGSAPPPTAAQAEVMRQDAGGRRERTMNRAAGAAETLRRSLRPAEESAAPEGAGAAAAASPPANPSGLAGPRTVPEMALAARSGYAATFRDQGLKVGAGPRGEPAIQRVDGSPASGPELERLGEALRAEPAALVRRPDFFEVLPRGKFADLKRDFADRPELRRAAFKDIGMTERGRDFQWSSSCSGLSGACNPHAGERSYRKGQDVPPEDLKKVWSAVKEEAAGADEEEFGEYSEEDRRLAEAEDLAAEKLGSGRRQPPGLSALLARMGDMARSLGESAGLASPSLRDAGESPLDARGAGAEAPISAASGRPASAGGRAVNAATSRADSSKANQPPAPEGRRTAESRSWIYALAAAAAAGLILKGLRKKPG